MHSIQKFWRLDIVHVLVSSDGKPGAVANRRCPHPPRQLTPPLSLLPRASLGSPLHSLATRQRLDHHASGKGDPGCWWRDALKSRGFSEASARDIQRIPMHLAPAQNRAIRSADQEVGHEARQPRRLVVRFSEDGDGIRGSVRDRVTCGPSR